MRRKQSHSESGDKGTANIEKPLTKAEAKKAMERFKSLSRDLLRVTPDKLSREERKWRKRSKRGTANGREGRRSAATEF